MGFVGDPHPEKKALNNERCEEKGTKCLEAFEANVPRKTSINRVKGARVLALVGMLEHQSGAKKGGSRLGRGSEGNWW